MTGNEGIRVEHRGVVPRENSRTCNFHLGNNVTNLWRNSLIFKVARHFGEAVCPGKVGMFSRMSSRQRCGSSGVRVLTPSITCIRRLAYSVRAEVTKHVQPERKSLGCPVR